MHAILNYTNTKVDLEVAKTRLNLLMDKKEALYCKYFSITPKLKDVVVDGGARNNDKMADYLHELTKINPNTGKSLEQEINDQLNVVQKLEYYLKRMETTLKDLDGMGADLYKEIIINGNKVSKAVEKIAERYNKDVSTIWRLYHREVKEYVNMLKIVS